ncbi:aminopeptidase [Amycolatopsis alkalitolerans]|uniref:Aminopeptidase n=2 Tax=Amycolatopsis alkalitolerans TaxID=2547244 RepID=A0A5C4M1N5_9PSEU|nr:aminopeptidase [Amycolatopsis alkalitolerans]
MAGVLVVSLTACGGNDGGTAAASVDGLPITHFESGLRPDAPPPDVQVRNVSDDQADQLAMATIADVETYWSKQLPGDFGVAFKPVSALLSYDSDGPDQQNGCGDLKGIENAFYCGADDSIAWDRGVLLPTMIKQFGPLSVVTVLAHEFGHAVQYRLGKQAGITRTTPTIVKEQQADCFAGGYYHWVVAGDSRYFAVSTAEGLDAALLSLFGVRDEAGTSATARGAHGTGFDRIFAFQLGFEQGPKACAGINEDNLKARVAERPFDPGDKNEGNIDIDDHAIELLKQSLDAAFAGAKASPPKIVDGSGRCQGGPSTPPASYCPGDNTVDIDLPALAALGQPVDLEAEQSGQPSEGRGDFAALSEVASRYALGIEKGVGASIDNANAGLRTACLVGAWAGAVNKLTNTELRLSAGDLDEAISDLLRPDSLIASDVNGQRVAAGFTRVEAMRTGYLQGSAPCSKNYA